MCNSARLLENKVETGVLRDVRGGERGLSNYNLIRIVLPTQLEPYQGTLIKSQAQTYLQNLSTQ